MCREITTYSRPNYLNRKIQKIPEAGYTLQFLVIYKDKENLSVSTLVRRIVFKKRLSIQE